MSNTHTDPMPKYMMEIYEEVNRLGNLFKDKLREFSKNPDNKKKICYKWDDVMEIIETSPYKSFIQYELSTHVMSYVQAPLEEYFIRKCYIHTGGMPHGIINDYYSDEYNGVILLLQNIIKTFLTLKQPPSQLEQYTVASYDMIKTVIEDCNKE